MSIPLLSCGSAKADGGYGGVTEDPDCLATYFGASLTDETYLSRAAPTGVSDGKLFTFSLTFQPVIHNSRFMFIGGGPSFITNNGTFEFFFDNISAAPILDFESAFGVISLNTGVWYTLVGSWDLSDSGKRHVYLNGTDIGTGGTWTIYTNENMDLTQNWYIGGDGGATRNWAGCLGEILMDDSYVDLSVLANREAFYDQGVVYPGADGSGPFGFSPKVWLPMDSTARGVNGGTGGDFTENGSAWDICVDVPQRAGANPPDPPPDQGVLVWSDPFSDQPAFPDLGETATWIPQPERLYGTWMSGILSWINPNILRSWNDRTRDAANNSHHTQLEINIGDPYQESTIGFGRALKAGNDYYMKFEVKFEMVGNDPEWIIFWQEKPRTDTNPSAAIILEDGRLFTHIRGDNNATLNPLNYDYNHETTLLAQVTYDQWYSVEYEIYHDPKPVGEGGQGYFICKLDMVELVNDIDIQTYFLDENIGGLNMSFGLYMWFSAPGNDENALQMRNMEIWDVTGVI